MGNQASTAFISGKKPKKHRADAKVSMSLNGRYIAKRTHQREDVLRHLHHQHRQQQFGDSAEIESRDFDDCEAAGDSRSTAGCLSALPSECTAKSSESSSAPSCSCSSFTVLSGDDLDLSGGDRETLVEDHLTMPSENDECWLTQNINFQPSVADLSDRQARNRDNGSSSDLCGLQGATASLYARQSCGYSQPVSHLRRQFFSNDLQQHQQLHETFHVKMPPDGGQALSAVNSAHGMVQQFGAAVPGGDVSGEMGISGQAAPETASQFYSQQPTSLLQQQLPAQAAQPTFASVASNVGDAKLKSVTASENAATSPQCVISRTVFVPQNWTSVIFFVKGTEVEAIARSCHVDLSVSCFSVNCSKREKDVLGTAKKRAVHIKAASVEDAASTVEQLLAVMPVLVSHPDLPERSCLIRQADGAAGDSSLSACLPDQALYRSPPEATISHSPCSRQPARNSATNATPAAAAAAATAATSNLPPFADPQSQTQIGAAADNKSFCSRRQLNERPAVLEVDVENTSAGLLPFFPGSSDRRGSVVAARSGCTIEITDKVRRKPAGEERRVLRVQGPSVSALEKCVRLLELYFPSMGARGQFRELRERLDFGAKQLRFS